MVTIQFYNNASATNVVNKELSQIVEAQGVFRSNTSISDPVVTVLCNNGDIWRKGFNYAYIEEFKRYYYVTNMVSVHGNTPNATPPESTPSQLWNIHMHVDVLMSFKDEIAAQTAIVARQEATYNLMLDDGIFMCYQNPKIQTKLFSIADPFETQEFVLIVAGS